MITVIREITPRERQVWLFVVMTFPHIVLHGYSVEVRATTRHKWRASKVWPGKRTSIRSLRLTRSQTPLPPDVAMEAITRASAMLRIDANLGAD